MTGLASPLMILAALLGASALLLLGACESDLPAPRSVAAAYRTPEIPPECRNAVYDDPKVHAMMVANAGVPTLRAENQDKLAFLQADALRRCMQQQGGVQQGGVEPIRYKWYPNPF